MWFGEGVKLELGGEATGWWVEPRLRKRKGSRISAWEGLSVGVEPKLYRGSEAAKWLGCGWTGREPRTSKTRQAALILSYIPNRRSPPPPLRPVPRFGETNSTSFSFFYPHIPHPPIPEFEPLLGTDKLVTFSQSFSYVSPT